MTFSTSLLQNYQTLIKKNWGWVLLLGAILTILGIAAISLATLTTLISIIFIGATLFIAGLVIIFDSFKFWWKRWLGFLLYFIIGILYLIAGFILLEHPLLGSVSLTFLLGIFYVLIGLFRMLYSINLRVRNWGFNFVNGLIALVLGVLILMAWPSSSLFIIGLFVGIDLLCAGIVYIMIALAARNAEPRLVE